MISAIVYTSNSGYTAEYARLLGRATGLPVNDLRQVHTPQPDEEVIFLGWLMADRVMGWPKANAFSRSGPCARWAWAPPAPPLPPPGRKSWALRTAAPCSPCRAASTCTGSVAPTG